MNPETFFDKFGLLADTPNGVQKLRELILQLAVQGKLVPQDPNDEPAAVLLEKIKAEREELVKEKKIKTEKGFNSINENEIPYEAPGGWKWVRLGSIFSLKTGATPSTRKSDYWDGSIRWLKSGDVNKGEIFECDGRITEKGLNDSNCKILPVDSVLIALNGQGKTRGTVAMLRIDAACNQSLVAMISKNDEYFVPEYLFLYLKSNYMNIRNITGHKQRRGLNMKIIGNLLVALPPPNEQRRIVTRLKQLMPLCDELEARQQKKQETRLRLNSAALDKLLTAHEPAEFANHWQRVCDNFDLLYDNPETVGELRKAILQLAVQGKLVRQDPNDEPAAVLLERIKVEKGKNAKKLKPLPPVIEDEIYFELPVGWHWARFDDICSYIQRGKGPKYVEKSDIPVISQKCIQWDGFKLDRARFISPSALEKYNEERFLRTGDLLWNSTGTGTIGRVNAYVHEDNSHDKVVADSHVTIVRPILLNSRFIYCWIASPIIQNEIEEMASGTTNQIELNLSTIKNHLVPLAPLEEQRRIVSKVDQLMALCDELEAKLNQSQTDGVRLMVAVVAGLVGA